MRPFSMLHAALTGRCARGFMPLMVPSLVHTAPLAEDWLSLDPQAEAIALVGPMGLAAGAAFDKTLPHIAVDGGINFAPSPLLWAGDGDSGTMPADIPAFLKPTQDETDLRFCLNGIRPWYWRHLHLYGFLGGRRDHELANLGEIYAEMLARRRTASTLFYDAAGVLQIMCFNSGTHTVNLETRFSLLGLCPVTVSLSGACDYPAENLSLPVLSGQGVSNIGSGMVTITADAPFCIIL